MSTSESLKGSYPWEKCQCVRNACVSVKEWDCIEMRDTHDQCMRLESSAHAPSPSSPTKKGFTPLQWILQNQNPSISKYPLLKIFVPHQSSWACYGPVLEKWQICIIIYNVPLHVICSPVMEPTFANLHTTSVEKKKNSEMIHINRQLRKWRWTISCENDKWRNTYGSIKLWTCKCCLHCLKNFRPQSQAQEAEKTENTGWIEWSTSTMFGQFHCLINIKQNSKQTTNLTGPW